MCLSPYSNPDGWLLDWVWNRGSMRGWPEDRIRKLQRFVVARRAARAKQAEIIDQLVQYGRAEAKR
jgi:hypothetical protein